MKDKSSITGTQPKTTTRVRKIDLKGMRRELIERRVNRARFMIRLDREEDVKVNR
jgi:hypothetical protein